jgi:hypothetical protein
MSINFNHTTTEEGEAKVSFPAGDAVVTIPDTHPNYKRILHALVEGNDPTKYINIFAALEELASDRVIVSNGIVLFDGEPVHDALSRTILRYTSEGRDTDNLVRFLERVNANPSRRSREQLWEWVQAADLHVDEDGCIVGWKSVQRVAGEPIEVFDPANPEADEDGTVYIPTESYRSHSTGTAWVNGVQHDGQIPYAIGDVVTIPRELVQDDPTVACSHGLHVGSFEYASTFHRGSPVMEVKVAPEHVVSVPRDSSCQKLRCEEFTVLGVQEIPTPDLTHYEPETDGWDQQELFDILEEEIPKGFWSRLADRWGIGKDGKA